MDKHTLAALLQRHDVDISGLSQLCRTPIGTIYTLTATKLGAVDTWHALHDLAKLTGYLPVISPRFTTLGYDDTATKDFIAYLRSDAVSRVIAAAEKIDPTAWLEERLTADAETAEQDGDDLEGYREELEGAWPAHVEPRSGFMIANSLSAEFHLVPTTVPWHVPAFYRYGGTSTPRPEEHVALLKYWSKDYGAEMLSYQGDVIEMHVCRPPQAHDEALALAWEHYGYCPDTVVQGTGSVAALAATLLQATAWRFWWD